MQGHGHAVPVGGVPIRVLHLFAAMRRDFMKRTSPWDKNPDEAIEKGSKRKSPAALSYGEA